MEDESKLALCCRDNRNGGALIFVRHRPVPFLDSEIIFVVKWDTITLSVLDPLVYLYNYICRYVCGQCCKPLLKLEPDASENKNLLI